MIRRIASVATPMPRTGAFDTTFRRVLRKFIPAFFFSAEIRLGLSALRVDAGAATGRTADSFEF